MGIRIINRSGKAANITARCTNVYNKNHSNIDVNQQEVHAHQDFQRFAIPVEVSDLGVEAEPVDPEVEQGQGEDAHQRERLHQVPVKMACNISFYLSIYLSIYKSIYLTIPHLWTFFLVLGGRSISKKNRKNFKNSDFFMSFPTCSYCDDQEQVSQDRD